MDWYLVCWEAARAHPFLAGLILYGVGSMCCFCRLVWMVVRWNGDYRKHFTYMLAVHFDLATIRGFLVCVLVSLLWVLALMWWLYWLVDDVSYERRLGIRVRRR